MDVLKEFTREELSRGVRNPFYEKLNREATASVRHEDYHLFEQIAQINGERVTAEDIMRRCLIDYAQILRETED